MRMKVIWIMIGLMGCSTVSEVVNPMQNPLTSWIFDKSCLSVDLPPITLTSEKTALERQILGDKTELLPNGWLITSTDYVSPLKEKDLTNNPQVRESLEVLIIYKDMIEYFMVYNYVGIDKKGNLLIVPQNLRNITNSKHLEIALKLINLINFHKNNIYQFLIQNDQSIAEDFLNRFIKTYSNLGWNYEERIGWYKN